MSRNKIDLSVVILCYKSHKFARVFHAQVLKELQKNKIKSEIILVANFKPADYDITPKVANEIAAIYKNTIAIATAKMNKNENMGWDMKMGMKASSGKVIAVIDGDGQMKASDIPKLYKMLKENDLDICKTKRVVRQDGLYRKMISTIYNIVMQVSFPGIVSDINGKPKVMTRDTYNKLRLVSDDWFIDAEMMIKARTLDLKIGQLDTSFALNRGRKSFITFSENFEFMRNILAWRFSKLKSV